MESFDLYDVAIVGASIAGSASAIGLASAGQRVALFDKSPFPRHKPCGEGLSHFAIPLLNDLAIDTRSLCNSENSFYGFNLIAAASGKKMARAFVAQGESLRGCGISRCELDQTLLTKAQSMEGASIFLNEAISGAKHCDDYWELQSSQRKLKARFLILAHGARGAALLPEFVDSLPGANQRVGYSVTARVVSGSSLPLVSVIPFADGELYLTPLKDSFLNISLVGTRSFIRKFRERPDFTFFLKANIGVDVEIVWRGAGAGHFEVQSSSTHPALFLVGDALESFDPACGLGMTHALFSARLVSQLISGIVAGKCDQQKLLREHQRVYEKSRRRIRAFSMFVRKIFFLFRLFPAVFQRLGANFSGILLAHIERLLDPTDVLTDSFLQRPEARLRTKE